MKLNLAFVIALIALAGVTGIFLFSPKPGDAKTGREIRKSAEPPPRVVPTPSAVDKELTPPISLKVTEKSPYEEIVHILKTHYADPSILDTQKPTQAAILGLLNSLDGSAQILSAPPTAPSPEPKSPAIQTVSALDSFIGYIRLHRIDKEMLQPLHEEVQKLVTQSHINGLILDLRFAQGAQYDAVAGAASIFLSEAKPLFSIHRGKNIQTYPSEIVTPSAKLPLMILVNGKTKGAPEALAAVLKDQRRALLIGSSETAGQAFETSTIPLSSGKILQLATGKIHLAQGGDLFLKKMEPDVQVDFDEKTEKEIMGQPFQPPEVRMSTHSFSEAILTGRTAAPPLHADKEKEEPEPASNRDLVLLRAIDLLKSIHALGLKSASASDGATSH